MNFTIHNEFLTVAAADKCAELQSVLGAKGTEFLWQGDPKYWCDRSLTLFPYVARLTNSQYTLDGELHEMSIHGLAPYTVFSLKEQTACSMTLEMTSGEETRKQYPREFSFQVTYRLAGNRLETVYRVENRDEKPMYFGLGGHPGINVPLSKEKSFEDYRLRFSEPAEPLRVGFTETCFLNGKDEPFPLENGTDLPLRHELFDHDAIVLRNMAKRVTLEADDGPKVTMIYDDMNYLGLWHWPKTDAPYVCLEPWCSLPSRDGVVEAFETQPSLLRLEPGETGEYCWILECEE